METATLSWPSAFTAPTRPFKRPLGVPRGVSARCRAYERGLASGKRKILPVVRPAAPLPSHGFTPVPRWTIEGIIRAKGRMPSGFYDWNRWGGK